MRNLNGLSFFLIYHLMLKNVVKNCVKICSIITQGGMSKDYVGLLGGRGGQADPQNGLRNC